MTEKRSQFETPKFRRRAGARPDEVLDAALQLFLRDGFEATRVEDIAKIAGISKATVYLYFPSKVALLEGLVKRSISPVAIIAESAMQQFEGSGQDAIRIVLGLVCEKMSDPNISGIPVLVMREASRFPDIAKIYYDEVISHVLPALRSVIVKGMASGEFREVDAEMTIRNIIGPLMLHVAAASVFGMGDNSADGLQAFLENHLNVLFNGLNKDSRDHG